MRYLVEVAASIERGNALDEAGGPGPMFAHIMERFKPEAFYVDLTRRHIFLVADLQSPAEIEELMYICTFAAGTDPKFTPVITLSEAASVIPEAIQNAKKTPGL